MTSLSFLSTPSILSIPSLLCLTWWSPGLLCVDCPFVLSVSDVSRSFLHHRRDRQNGFRFGKNRFRHLLKPGFSCGQNWTKPGFRWWPKTGSMIEENRFNGEFKISPWRNFVNINKLFSYVAPNYSEELENTVCHQRWRKHANRRRLTRRPRPSFLLYCWERKIEQQNISFIFFVGGCEGFAVRRVQGPPALCHNIFASLIHSIFWSTPDMCSHPLDKPEARISSSTLKHLLTPYVILSLSLETLLFVYSQKM